MKGSDIGLDMVLEFGFRDQHAGNEGAQRQAQTRQLSQPSQTQRD